MQVLRQNTAIDLAVGPFVDATDGFTAETALTLATMEQAHVFKHGGAALVSISGNTWAHLAQGIYKLSLNAGDVDVLGRFEIFLNKAGTSRPVRHDLTVLAASVYDALISAGTLLPASMAAIVGDAVAAANMGAAANGLVRGLIVAGSTVALLKTNLTEATNDHYNGRTVVFVTGALAGQACGITDYDGTLKQLTVSTLTDVPQPGDAFVIV